MDRVFLKSSEMKLCEQFIFINLARNKSFSKHTCSVSFSGLQWVRFYTIETKTFYKYFSDVFRPRKFAVFSFNLN